jgi:ADP-ribosylarginine hydrolase
MKTRFEACMLLAAVGDAIGYKRGSWEFNQDGPAIHKEMLKITEGKGVLKLEINKRNFPYSDDTVMHLATARGILNCKKQ